MAHIAIFIGAINHSGSSLQISGDARLSSDGGVVEWTVLVSYGALTSQINQAVQNAAVASAETAGYTIGPTDNKTLFAGAGGV